MIVPFQPPQQPQQEDNKVGFGRRAMNLLSALGGGMQNLGSNIGQAGRGVLGFIQNNPELIDRATIAIEGMSQRPNQPLIQMAQASMEQRQLQELSQDQANKTAQYFISQGRQDLADAVLAAPYSSGEILQGYVAGIAPSARQFALQSSTPRTDPETGQVYVVQADPATGEVTRVNIEGTFEETPLERFNRERFEEGRRLGVALAQDLGQQITANIRMNLKYDEIEDLIRKAGAKTGILDTQLGQYFNPATAQLINIANQLGLDVVSSVTFGALSEKELNLALQTALPTNIVSEADMLEFLDQKRAAIEKLNAFLSSELRMLYSPNMTLDLYYQSVAERALEAGVRPEDVMTVPQSTLDAAVMGLTQ